LCIEQISFVSEIGREYLLKQINALVIGFTMGLISGYTINAHKYYWDGIETTKEYRDRSLNTDLEKRRKYPTVSPTPKEGLDTYRKEALMNTTKEQFNMKGGLLSGSITTSLLILIFLCPGLKKNTK
jgi:hypothetical protein